MMKNNLGKKDIIQWYEESKKCIDNQIEGISYERYNILEIRNRLKGIDLCIELFYMKCEKDPEFNKYKNLLENYVQEKKSKLP